MEKKFMGALKKHFKGDEDSKLKEEEKSGKGYKNKSLDKDSRKKMAVMLIKKKMA